METLFKHQQPAVLLIEDSASDALLIERQLKIAMPEGCAIQKSCTLEDALKLVSQKNFNVALLDRSLPDVEGFEGLHRIQNIAPQLPIVFLTAYKDEQVAMDAIAQGAQDYLFKDAMDGQSIKKAIKYAIMRKMHEGDLTSQAFFDNLTGLANRMMFENRLNAALTRHKRTGKCIGLLFLDMDGFKEVNDTYGHAAGDRLLKEVAQCLKGAVRGYDTAARFGGDEFAILIEDITTIAPCITAAGKIIAQIDQPIDISPECRVHAGVSIGITFHDCQHPTDIETLTGKADAAMYEAKACQGSCYRIHQDNLSSAASQHVA